jgi:ankyrin repeat protein
MLLVLDGDIEKKTLLSYATARGHRAVVKLLLETRNVDIDSEDKSKWMPLWAAWNGHATVELLLEKGAEKEIRSIDGRTPLSSAMGNGRANVVLLRARRRARGCV